MARIRAAIAAGTFPDFVRDSGRAGRAAQDACRGRRRVTCKLAQREGEVVRRAARRSPLTAPGGGGGPWHARIAARREAKKKPKAKAAKPELESLARGARRSPSELIKPKRKPRWDEEDRERGVVGGPETGPGGSLGGEPGMTMTGTGTSHRRSGTAWSNGTDERAVGRARQGRGRRHPGHREAVRPRLDHEARLVRAAAGRLPSPPAPSRSTWRSASAASRAAG